jgi:hypothetical protein
MAENYRHAYETYIVMASFPVYCNWANDAVSGLSADTWPAVSLPRLAPDLLHSI